ncbi:319_t:CDS:2 [Ambispora leptoticha]|uniref:319_t:CDS:1 n=1 Tax=Ambispora leptoticha TaxID=144679 RepID=A0A9N9BK89_9GLOM|nr:319_t:CDS:2 [Ambispora leptoticha]
MSDQAEPYTVNTNDLSLAVDTAEEIQLRCRNIDDYRPQFPPDLNLNELVNKTKKPPNHFLIYRKAVWNRAKALNHKLSMSEVSNISSKLWKKEEYSVKEAYKGYSSQMYKIWKEKYQMDSIVIYRGNMRKAKKMPRKKSPYKTKRKLGRSQQSSLPAHPVQSDVNQGDANENTAENNPCIAEISNTGEVGFEFNTEPMPAFDTYIPQNQQYCGFPDSLTPIKVTVPSPEELDINEFLPKGKTSKKTPNSYFIYRKVYVDELRKLGYKSKMIRVSSWSGIAWKEETRSVKSAYIQFAHKLSKLYENRLREERERKRNEPIKIIEFQPDAISNNDNKGEIAKTETGITINNQISPDIPSIDDQEATMGAIETTTATASTSTSLPIPIFNNIEELASPINNNLLINPYPDALLFVPFYSQYNQDTSLNQDDSYNEPWYD